MSNRSIDQAGRTDRGSALVMTLMVMALVTALATTVATVTVNNLQSSTSARQAGSALNAADAGLSQAVTYLRSSGVRDLRCSPSCAAGTYGNSTTPMSVVMSGSAGQSFKVWIEAVAPFPANTPGLYRIHSTGKASGAASRTVTLDVGVTTSDVPMGIFARSINGGGSASVTRQSIFSTGCIYDREKIAMVKGEMDAAYGIPIGAHSSQIITTANGNNANCSTGNSDIHKDGPCDSRFPYDQDRLGGSLLGTACESTQTSYPKYYAPKNLDPDATNEVNGSFIESDTALYKLFGFRNPALTQAQIDALRATAASQGNLITSATGWTSPDETNAVMFFDLTGADTNARTVNLNNVVGFGRDKNLSSSSADCPSRSLTIVIVGGNATLNSNQQLVASLFLTSSAPYGQVSRANGTADYIGSIYADTINLIGNVDISSDTCFVANVSPALLDVRSGSYRELDR
jgi:Tfp pilus assembly protein PilX